MSDVKTKPSSLKVSDYLATITDDARLADVQQLLALMGAVTGEPPVMWGTGIVGFGTYHYKYASGREGVTMQVGLSARKEHIALYGVIQYDENTELLDQLGVHTRGKGCLYIKKLADVKLDILEQLIRNGART